MWAGRVRWIVGIILFIAGCQDSGALKGAMGPGSSAWKDEESVQCTTDADCGAGETCRGAVCQMQRCAEPGYTSQPPLGTVGYFKRDREIVIAETVSIPGATLGSFDVRHG